MRNFRLFSRSKFKRDLALGECFRMYQFENGNDMFDSFIDIFEQMVEKHASIQSVKKGGETYKNSKPWLTQELKHLIAQKHFLFNNWKKIPHSETYREFKRLRNLVNRRLREAHCKLAIGVQLQFALNECIKEKVFPTKMKLAYVTPIFK